MSFYKFGSNDIFHNVIKTHPQCRFLIYSGTIRYNSKPTLTGSYSNDLTHVPPGHINLHEINVNRPSDGMVYSFVTKGGSKMAPKTVSAKSFNNSSGFALGDVISSSYPMSATISKDFYAENASRNRISALRNSLDYYATLSRHYLYSSSFGDKATQPLGLVSIPSIFYGSTIKRGTVNLRYYVTGTLVGELRDEGQRGELVQVGPVGSTGSGSVAGVALYNEGFLVLTGSWALDPNHGETYDAASDNPRWYYFGQSMSGTIIAISSSYTLEFSGTNPVPVTTMFAHAPAGELNYSSNPTYIEYGQNITPKTGSTFYVENDELAIKNTVSSAYADPTGSFKKQTFISKIGLYDEKKNLIGVAKLATPVKKTEERDFTFKLKLDF